jgi:putative copper export protein
VAEDHLLDGALAHGLTVGGLAMLLVPTVGRWLGVAPAERLGRELARSGAVLLVGASLLHGVNGWIGATGALDPAQLPAVLLETGYGRSVLWFAAASALLVAGWGRPRAAVGSAALVVVGASWLGHAAVQGELSWLALTHAVHLAAVVGWLTGLCVLVVRPEQVAAARFSAVAPPLVAAIVLTGAALAWVHLVQPLSLGTSVDAGAGADRPLPAGWAYAVALAAKLGVAAAAGALALANRRLVRRGAPSEGVLQAELLAAFVTALLGAALTQVEPP